MILNDLQVVATIDVVDNVIFVCYPSVVRSVGVGEHLGSSVSSVVHIALYYIQCHIVRQDVQVASEEYRMSIFVLLEVC